MKKWMFIVLLLIGKISFSCSCDEIPYFQLADYDQSKHIIEVKFVEEIFLDSNYFKNKNPLEPPCSFEYGLDRRYKIELIEQYKGVFRTKDSIIDVSNYGSCDLQPTFGKTYIVYLTGRIFNFEMCQTIITKGSKRYESEKEILTFLKNKKGKLNQIQLGELILEGQFNNKKRVGKWVIYFPDSDGALITIRLTYKKGILINVVSSMDVDKIKSKKFQNYAYEYYNNFLQKD